MFRPFLLAFLIHRAAAFVVCNNDFGNRGPRPTRMQARRSKKQAMAEKRRKRAKRLKPRPTSDLPPAKLSLGKAEEEKSSTELGLERAEEEEESSKSRAIYSKDAREAASKAKELLKAQRDSVDMLTMVRERVERLTDLAETLDKQGYWFCDNFLDASDVIDQLQREGETLLQEGEMQVDVKQIGTGEYVCSLQGGQDQYLLCPRSIEWVVGVTKNMPDQSHLNLDPTNCIASMRTFDRKTLQASAELLMGEATTELLPGPFVRVVNDVESDYRRLSLRYYLVPDDWDKACGGSLTFQETGETVDAKRDRLVIWKSNEAFYQSEPWKGSSDIPLASCIDLHLVQML